MSHSDQFRDTPHYVPLTGEIRAGKIQGEARGYPDAQSGTVDWTGNPTTISSPDEMRFDDMKYRIMAVPDGVRKSSNFPRHDSDGITSDIVFLNRYNSISNRIVSGYGTAYAPTSNYYTQGTATMIDGDYLPSNGYFSGYSFLDQDYPTFGHNKGSGYHTHYTIGTVRSFTGGNPMTRWGIGKPHSIDSDCSMLYSRFRIRNSGHQQNEDWNTMREQAFIPNEFGNYINTSHGDMIANLSDPPINDPIPTDSAVSGGFSESFQLLFDRSNSGPFNNVPQNGRDYAEPPKLANNRGIGEIRFSDFRGKSQVYKSDFAEGDNHGYGQYGYYGYGQGNWGANSNWIFFQVAANGMFLSGGTNSVGTALSAYGFVHPDFGGKSSPTGITLPNAGGAIDIMNGNFSGKQFNADTDGNLHFHQKYKTHRKTGQGSSSTFYADVANYGRCTHMIWYTDATFTTGDFAGMNGQIGTNASWPGGTHGTAVGPYVFEIGFSGRLRNTLFEKISWTNGTHANNTSNNSFYYGAYNGAFHPRSNYSEVAYRGAHADNGYFGQTVWRGLYSCGTTTEYGGPADAATESRPLPSNTTSTTATGNCGRLKFFMRNSSGIGWNEWE